MDSFPRLLSQPAYPLQDYLTYRRPSAGMELGSGLQCALLITVSDVDIYAERKTRRSGSSYSIGL
ncbi:MAG: hypothetical protein P4M12_08615 [Gammaproteobacteria bacterium]|nr:hypothetical protein [Gammaproteobacteria bacterium]